MTLSFAPARVPYVSYAIRTGASVFPDSSRSGSGRSAYWVWIVPTVPRRSSANERAPFEMQRLEQRDAESEQARVAPVARASGRHAQDIRDARGPVGEEDHTIGEVHGFVEVVRHEDQCGPVAGPCGEEVLLEAHAGERVEGAERLVEQQHLRLGDERPGERRALGHAA